MIYLAIIFDIKDSKQLPNREDIQYKLIDAIKEANFVCIRKSDIVWEIKINNVNIIQLTPSFS